MNGKRLSVMAAWLWLAAGLVLALTCPVVPTVFVLLLSGAALSMKLASDRLAHQQPAVLMRRIEIMDAALADATQQVLTLQRQLARSDR